jgi:predicted RNA-binding protein with PIN domain
LPQIWVIRAGFSAVMPFQLERGRAIQRANPRRGKLRVCGDLARAMPFLIDGHNLIPHVPGHSLSDPDDEAHLVAALHGFASRNRRRIVVYFDRRAGGLAPNLSRAGVQVHFVAPPKTADEGIRRHLEGLRGEARNWTVVSSDMEVRRSAEKLGAAWLSAADFARRLQSAHSRKEVEDKPDQAESDSEVQEWERLFTGRKTGRRRGR